MFEHLDMWTYRQTTYVSFFWPPINVDFRHLWALVFLRWSSHTSLGNLSVTKKRFKKVDKMETQNWEKLYKWWRKKLSWKKETYGLRAIKNECCQPENGGRGGIWDVLYGNFYVKSFADRYFETLFRIIDAGLRYQGILKTWSMNLHAWIFCNSQSRISKKVGYPWLTSKSIIYPANKIWEKHHETEQ